MNSRTRTMPPIVQRRPAPVQDVQTISAPGRSRAVASALPQGRLHGPLLVVTIVMVCFGLVMLFSASMSDGYANKEGNPMYYVLRQASITGVGLIAALLLALFFNVRFFDRIIFTVLLYGVTTALLLLVMLMGETTNGGQRWLELGPLRFQPSELAKLAAVFCFAGYTSWVRRRREAGKMRARSPFRQFLLDGFADILFPGFALLLWAVLILWQPHMSGFLIMGFIILTIFLASGVRFRSYVSGISIFLVVILALVLVLSTALPMLISREKFDQIVEENFAHVQKRIDTFTNPEEASSDDTLQIRQSLIAIGSGGLTGLGLGEGRQKYNYLPESHNDFVFAIIGEELGFAGTVSVVLLFVVFLFCGVSVAMSAANSFSTILAGGYTMLIVIQAFLNIGVTTRLLPTTGISLPFFSYGGTANLFFLVAIGFILCVSRTGQRPSMRQI